MRISDWSSDVCSSDLQPARARPYLELCRQQLSARQRLSALRPPLLERRYDQPAREVAPAISGRPLSRQSHGHPEQPVGDGDADRPQEDRDPRLYPGGPRGSYRSEEHTSELQSLMRISYAVFCLKKKK